MPRSDRSGRPDPSGAPHDPPGAGTSAAGDLVAGAGTGDDVVAAGTADRVVEAGTGDDGGAEGVAAEDVTEDDVVLAARVTRIARAVDDDDFARQVPPAELWDRIAAAVVSAPDGASAAGDLEVVLVSQRAGEPAQADVVSIEGRHRQMNRSVMIAVAASVVLFAALGFLFTRGDSSPDPQLVAAASLEPVDGADLGDTTADVRLVADGEERRLVLSARDMAAAPTGHHFELWLLDPADGEPVSLGAMAGSVSVPVPADIDLEAYQVVDVSVQADGQVEHSGNSVLRGTLA